VSASPRDADRAGPGVRSLRRHAAGGTLINAGFQTGLAAVSLLRGVAIAAFLTREEFGIWGVVLTILVTLAWLKEVGIVDRYIQQSEPDQEAAFQKAFTLELAVSGLYFGAVLLVIPLYALAYGESDLILPAVILALNVPLTALAAPAWVAYRRMQYLRQRVLLAIDPLVGFVVTIALGIAGAGYWSLVVGVLVGSAASAAACIATSPYRIRLRFDRGTLRDYASFSWPLFGGGVSRLVIVQGALIAVNRVEGLAAIGSITLATSIVIFADRVDQIVSQTIYPAVCAVADRVDVLRETFVKTNRIALMWAVPFATGLALFAHDLTRHVLGERWEPAAWLMAALAISTGGGQVAFNWTVFMRAIGRTRPIFVAAVVDFAMFAAVTLPAIVAFGLTGYAAGFGAATLAQLVVRHLYMRSLFPGFNVLTQLARAIAPTLPGLLIVAGARLALPDGGSAVRAAVEFAVFAAVTIACTYGWERPLIREMAGYLRRDRVAAPAAAA
jgi:O-antigen/teichoic acid export membrane protein